MLKYCNNGLLLKILLLSGPHTVLLQWQANTNQNHNYCDLFALRMFRNSIIPTNSWQKRMAEQRNGLLLFLFAPASFLESGEWRAGV